MEEEDIFPPMEGKGVAPKGAFDIKQDMSLLLGIRARPEVYTSPYQVYQLRINSRKMKRRAIKSGKRDATPRHARRSHCQT